MINHSRLSHRTISEYWRLHYRDLDKVKDIVREGNALLQARDDIGYFVFRFDSFGDTSLKLYVYAWAQTAPRRSFLPYAEYMRIKEDVLLSLADIAQKRGCKLILPVSHVYLPDGLGPRSEEHTSELQSLMRISYAVFCLKNKKKTNTITLAM